MDMKHVKYLALVLCIGNLSPVMAQTASKSLTVDNLVAWQRISGQSISDNGKWVACKMEPWEGDAVVNLYDAQGKELATFPRRRTKRILCRNDTKRIFRLLCISIYCDIAFFHNF